MSAVGDFMAGQNVTGGGAFSADIAAFAAKTQLRLDMVLKKVLFDIAARVIMPSPVGNRTLWKINSQEKRDWRNAHGRNELKPDGYVGGHFRANWVFGETTMPSSIPVPEGQASYPDAQACWDAITAQMASVKFGMDYWIVNCVPYAIPLEYGWSTQAPMGMVRTTMANAQSMVDKAVGETRGL